MILSILRAFNSSMGQYIGNGGALSTGQGSIFLWMFCALAFLKTAQKGAVGGVSDLETAVDGLSSVVNAFGKESIDAGRASDIMFTAVKQGKTTFAEISGNTSERAKQFSKILKHSHIPYQQGKRYAYVAALPSGYGSSDCRCIL